MKSRLLFGMLLLLLFALCSCAEKPPADTLAAAYYGPYPTEYREIVQSYYDGLISDFASAQFEWLKPPYAGNIFYSCGKIHYGYLVQAAISIRNHIQDTEKQVNRIFLIKDGVVIDKMPL